MKNITIRNVSIGDGIPKIIAPIVGNTEHEIIEEAKAITVSGTDIAEWRIDHFISGTDPIAVGQTAQRLRALIGNMPLLITFRTQKEGGATAIEPETYARLLTDICRLKAIDMIDVEAFTGEALVRSVIGTAHENGIAVVASNHDFQSTPTAEEILRRLTYMAELGADIPKVAVMPANQRDVLLLLTATAQASEALNCPLITMAMGPLGVISRLAGECFGSACTFGSVGQASAPGQVPVAQLRGILQLLHGQ